MFAEKTDISAGKELRGKPTRLRVKQLLLPALGILTVPVLLLPPEGMVRSGDSFLLLFAALALWGFGIVLELLYKNESGGVPDERRGLCRTDTAVVLLLGCFLLSWLRLHLFGTGNRLQGANGFWTFALMPLFYGLVRRVPACRGRQCEVFFFAVLIGAAVFEAGISLYSYYVTAPELRSRFETDPEGLLRESGMHIEKDSAEFLLFKKRILDSTEPIGTYGMTNTLAGFLLPVLLLLAAILPSFFFRRSSPGENHLPIPLLWLPILLAAFGFTFLLTKSRTGYLALLAGILALPALSIRNRLSAGKSRRKGFFLVTFGILAGFVLLLIGAFRFGILDREVFSEAKKSLGYRLDYWTASSRIIADHPLFGVGPGNFQAVYTQYILPTASETVADPHNFAFELASLFGIPALIFFTVFLVFTARAVSSNHADPPRPPYRSVFLVFLGGYLLYAAFNVLVSAPTGSALLFGFAPLFLAASFPAAQLASRLAALPSSVLFAVLCAGLLNLCAAGGIGYPAVSIPLWILAALIINRCENHSETHKFPRSFKIGTLLVWGVLFLLFLRTDFFPNIAERNVLTLVPELTPAEALNYLTETAKGAGRDSISIRSILCEYTMNSEAVLPSSERFSEWKEAKNALFAISPASASVRTEIGQKEFELYQKTKNQLFLDASIDSLAEGVRLFPTDAVTHARYAVALHEAGKTAEAEAEKAEAFRLDTLTPHEDRKLPAKLKSLLTWSS